MVVLKLVGRGPAAKVCSDCADRAEQICFGSAGPWLHHHALSLIQLLLACAHLFHTYSVVSTQLGEFSLHNPLTITKRVIRRGGYLPCIAHDVGVYVTHQGWLGAKDKP